MAPKIPIWVWNGQGHKLETAGGAVRLLVLREALEAASQTTRCAPLGDLLQGAFQGEGAAPSGCL